MANELPHEENKIAAFHQGQWRQAREDSNNDLGVLRSDAMRMSAERLHELTLRLADFRVIDLEALNEEAAQEICRQWRPAIGDLIAAVRSQHKAMDRELSDARFRGIVGGVLISAVAGLLWVLIPLLRGLQH
jgi:hypothetical protein